MATSQPVGNTITMTGSTDHISVADNDAWDLPGDFTLSVKVKFTVNKWHMLLTHHGTSSPAGFEFSYTGHSLLLSPNGFQVCINPAWVATLNTWYTLSVSRQGNTFIAFVDGVVIGTSTFSSAIGIDNYPLMIGNYSFAGYNFYGEMDDVSIWNSAISSSQMQNVVAGTLTGNEPNLLAFYNMNRTGQGAGLTVANQSVTGAIFNGVTVGSATTPYFNAAPTTTPAGALNFDGINDGVVINNSASVQLNTGTAEAWIKTPGAGSSFRGIIVKQWAYSLFLYNNELICYDWSTGITSTGINLADNQWHHVAVSFASGVPNGSKIYVDGALVKTFTYHIVNQSIGVSLGIGADYSVQNFAGTIDEARIWNRQLSLAEIQNNKNCEVPVPATGLVAYYKLNQGIQNANNSGIITATDASGNGNNGSLINFGLTGSTSNWVAGNINGTCAVFSSAYNITSSSGANGIISPSGITSVTSGGSQTYTITPNPGYQIADVLANGVSVGAVASYSFNNVTAPHTLSATFNLISIPAGALQFDGSNDYVEVPHNNALNSLPLTVECWVKSASMPGVMGLVNKYISGSGNGWRLGANNGYAEIYYYIPNGAGGFNYTSVFDQVTPQLFIADNVWHHVAMVVDNSGTQLYIDGTVRASSPWTGTPSVPTTSTPLRIGSYPAPGSLLNGTIDEVRIWNRALCALELQNNKDCELQANPTGLIAYYKFNEGIANGNNAVVTSVPDASGNGLNGTLNNFSLNGSTSNWVAGKVTGTCSSTVSCVVAPDIAISPTTLNFEDVPLGTSKLLPINITNNSNSPIVIYSVAWPNSPIFTSIGFNPTINPGQIIQVDLKFSPSIAGQVNGSYVVTYSTSPIPITLQVRGNGTAPISLPEISLSTSSINYGNLGLGFSLTDSVIITNTGTAPLNISGIVSSNPVYTFTYAKNTIAPGDTTRLIVEYTPAIAGAALATLTISHNATGSPTIINLNGIAVATGYTYQVNQISGFTGNLFGATWFSNKVGFVSGAGGKIYKTLDGGINWTLVPVGTAETIYSIRSIGSALWIFGSNGLICVSNDGGQTFTPFTSGATNIFNDGYFVNGYYGFAVGSNGTLCRFNGTGWEPYNLGLPNNFYGVYAYGRSAWAVGSGGIVCRYNYASNSWGPVNPGVSNDLYGVGFWNDNIGYVVGSGGLIYRTVNGGTNWTPCVSGVNVNIRSVRCFSATVAWACCENGDVLQTTDGGLTWVRLPLGGFKFQRIDFNGCQGIAICNNGAVVTFQTNLCNGGYNTSRYVRRGTGTSYGYNNAWYSTKLNGGIAGRYGTVLITNNGGLTWGSTNPYTTEHINCIKLFGNTSFIAGNGGYIAKCNNLGTNWVRFPGIPGNINFHSIAFYPNGTGWAVGSGGTICYYNGTGWVPYNLGGITNTFRCVYVTGNVAYAVGDNGIICKYNGTAWVDVSPGVTNDFYGCAFVSPLIGYAVGRRGIICKTIDGGNTWFPITSPTIEDLNCVEVGCKLEAMVAGKNGTAHQTTDGGVSWIDYSLDRAVDINSITILDGEGLLAAEDGEVYAFQFGSGKVIAELTAGGPTTFCEGGSVILTATGGSSYLWSNGATTPSITATVTGTYSVIVSNAAGCSDEKQLAVTVNKKPVIAFLLQTEICSNATPITLSATPAGGSFSGAGVSGNTFDPAIAGAGVKSISYTVTTIEGCSSTKIVEITVNPLPALTFTLPLSICKNAASIQLSATPTGGIFSGSGVTGNSFNPASAGAGSRTITYTFTTDKGCSTETTANIVVNDVSPLSFTLPAFTCSNATPITLSGSPAGGIFSGAGVSGNTFDPAIAGAGVKSISYTVTTIEGCSSTKVVEITVNAVPAITFTLPLSICKNAASIQLAATPTGGIFSGQGVTGNTFNPASAGAGSRTITYTFTTDKGCITETTANILVNDVSPLSFTIPAFICSNATPITLSATPSGGSFSGAGISGNTFDPAIAGAGVKTIIYSYTNSNGCSNSISKNTTVNTSPIANAGADKQVYFGYSPMACTDLNGTATSGTTPYKFSWSNGIITAANHVCPMATTSYTLKVTDANGCKSSDDVIVKVTDVRCGPDNRKVKVCHTEPKKQDVTICIDENAVPTHLANGDHLGECLYTIAKMSKPVEETMVVNKFNIYPNPTNGNFTIDMPGIKGNITIIVYSANGIIVARKELKGNKSSTAAFSLLNVAKGIYTVQMLSNNKMQTSKLIIQ